MTKQIIIKHSSDDMDAIINDILKYLEVLIPAEARVICSFRLHGNDMTAWSEIGENLKSVVVQKKAVRKSLTGKEYLDIELSISYDDIVGFLRIAEKHEINADIRYKSIVVCINDNDGDFVVMDSKDMLYSKIKKILNGTMYDCT